MTGFGRFEFVTGALMVVLGVFTLCRPDSAVTGLVALYALAAVVLGICDVVFYVKAERYTGLGSVLSLVCGIVSVMAGIMLLVYPNAGKWILSLLFPLWFLANCIFRLSNLSILRRTAGNFFWCVSLVVNVLGVVLGVLMLLRPMLCVLTVSFIIGSYLILLGIDSILVAFSAVGSQR
ncbi:MAG: DUF308 domain-containing protein [Oscillospiraceae bacterium]|nr:DUF308 domain-containing protein [Oscillospiraceae bacterium]